MRHIDSCPWCGPVIHGDGDLFTASIEDEARGRMAERRKVRRRRFLKIVAAGLVGVTVAGMGFAKLRRDGRTESGPHLEKHANDWTATMDRLWAMSGEQGVRLAMLTMSLNELERTMQWVVQTGRGGLYPDLVVFLSDPNTEVKRKALGWLFQIAPTDLQPQLASLETTLDTETDAQMRAAIGGLVTRVRDR